MSKISPAAAMVKPTPPRAMRVSMSKPTHHPQGYAWLMLAIVAIPVAKRTIVVITAATTRPQRINRTGHGHRGLSVVCMLLVSVLVVSPESEASADDHGDDGHRHPDGREDLGREVQDLRGKCRRGLVGKIARVAEFFERDRREMKDGGPSQLVQAIDVGHVEA